MRMSILGPKIALTCKCCAARVSWHASCRCSHLRVSVTRFRALNGEIGRHGLASTVQIQKSLALPKVLACQCFRAWARVIRGPKLRAEFKSLAMVKKRVFLMETYRHSNHNHPCNAHGLQCRSLGKYGQLLRPRSLVEYRPAPKSATVSVQVLPYNAVRTVFCFVALALDVPFFGGLG